MFFQIFAGWAILMWTSCISLHMFFVVRNIQARQRFEKYFHFVSWSMSLFWSVWPFFWWKYGKAGIWCWVVRDATALRFGIWYVPIYSITIVLLFFYIYIIYAAVKQNSKWTGTLSQFEEERKNELMAQVKPLAVYPLIYILFNIPTLVMRIDDANTGYDVYPHYGIAVACMICSPSLGAVYALAFALDRATLAYLKPTDVVLTVRNRIAGASRTRITHDYQVEDTSAPSTDASNTPRTDYETDGNANA